MKSTSKALTVAFAATLTTPAIAQTAAPPADPMMTNPAPVEEDDDDFPWGLLGLLGLAGLIPRQRRDDNVRVDRTDSTNRPR